MKLEPGQRVRCVHNSGVKATLTLGAEYIVLHELSNFVWLHDINTQRFHASRFKPVVRVPWMLGERVR